MDESLNELPQTKSVDTMFSYIDDEILRKSRFEPNAKPRVRRYRTRHMRLYPELYRSDVSINPSYTKLRNLPYQVICRQRLQRMRKQVANQMNREIKHFTMMEMFALDSLRVDRIFSNGMSPKITIVKDFATERERRHIEEILL